MLHIIGALVIVYLLIGLIGKERTFHLIKAAACFGAVVVIIAVAYAITH